MGSENANKVTEEFVDFIQKRNENEEPRYIARLKAYVDLQNKRRKAAAARRHSQHSVNAKHSNTNARDDKKQSRKKLEAEQKKKLAENTDTPADGYNDDNILKRRAEKGRSLSPSRSEAPSDKCGCRRRRKPCRRRRRRSCCRRRRRRRSCRRRRRRSCRRRRRRRRSSSRRRRRRCCRR